MSFGHFPADYGQGTGLGAGHNDLVEQINQMIAGGHPDVPLARRMVNKTVYVDPVNGDDHPANDGSKTPLKSLDALSKRVPEGMTIDADSGYFGRSIIKMLPGDYNLERDLFLRLPPNTKLEGTYEEVESFVLDSYQSSNLDLHKNPGTPVWAPGQFEGMFIKVDFYGFIDILMPILDSGDHWIRIAWDWNWISGTAPSVTDTIVIYDLTSVIRGNGKTLTLDLGASSIVGELAFDGLAQVYSIGAYVSYNHCRFSNASYGVLTLKGDQVYAQCLFRDISYAGIQVAYKGSAVSFRGCAFLRCPDAISIDLDAMISFIYEVSFFKDCPEAIKSGFAPGIRIYHNLDSLYCENVTNWIKTDNGADIALLVALTSAIEGNAPTNLITAKNGSKVSLHAGSTLEAVANSLNINGVTSTLANFFAGGGHNGWISDQNGNRVFART